MEREGKEKKSERLNLKKTLKIGGVKRVGKKREKEKEKERMKEIYLDKQTLLLKIRIPQQATVRDWRGKFERT